MISFVEEKNMLVLDEYTEVNMDKIDAVMIQKPENGINWVAHMSLTDGSVEAHVLRDGMEDIRNFENMAQRLKWIGLHTENTESTRILLFNPDRIRSVSWGLDRFVFETKRSIILETAGLVLRYIADGNVKDSRPIDPFPIWRNLAKYGICKPGFYLDKDFSRLAVIEDDTTSVLVVCRNSIHAVLCKFDANGYMDVSFLFASRFKSLPVNFRLRVHEIDMKTLRSAFDKDFDYIYSEDDRLFCAYRADLVLLKPLDTPGQGAGIIITNDGPKSLKVTLESSRDDDEDLELEYMYHGCMYGLIGPLLWMSAKQIVRFLFDLQKRKASEISGGIFESDDKDWRGMFRRLAYIDQRIIDTFIKTPVFERADKQELKQLLGDRTRLLSCFVDCPVMQAIAQIDGHELPWDIMDRQTFFETRDPYRYLDEKKEADYSYLNTEERCPESES